MEGANNYTNLDNFEKDHKMEIENTLESNHSNIIKNNIFARRTLGSYPANKSESINRKKLSLPTVLNNSKIDIIKYMNEVMTFINDLSSKKNFNIFNIKNHNFEEIKTNIIISRNFSKLNKWKAQIIIQIHPALKKSTKWK